MTVRIVTDSACSLEPDYIKEKNITVVPLQISFGGKPHEEELISGEFLDAERANFSSSAPSPGSFASAIEEADNGDGVIVLTVGGRFSSTFQAALLGSSIAKSESRVLDTRTAAGAQGLVVAAASRAAELGYDLDGVAYQAKIVIERVRLVAAIGTLEYLIKSGRVPNVLGRLGQKSGLKPIFELSDGTIRPLRPALSHKGSTSAMVSRLRRDRDNSDRDCSKSVLHVAALHAANPGGAEELLAEAIRNERVQTCLIGKFGPVMIGHTGFDVLGLAWWREAIP